MVLPILPPSTVKLWCRLSCTLLPQEKTGIQSLALRHLKKTVACQQGGLKLDPPVKLWSLDSRCDCFFCFFCFFFVECIGIEVVHRTCIYCDS